MLLPMMAMCAVFASLMSYMWSFITKFILDILETSGGDTAPLIHLLLIVAAVETISMFLNTIAWNRSWFMMIEVRMHMINDCMAKLLTMNYQSLEQPDILDAHQKAQNSNGGNIGGCEGLMHEMQDLAINSVTLIVTVTTIFILDWRLILIISVVAFGKYLYFQHIVKKDKKCVWDKLAPVWRRINYMERTTQDFDYAKDIHLFGMKKWLCKKQREILDSKQEKVFYSKRLWSCYQLAVELTNMIPSLAAYAVLIFAVINTDMSIGDFTLYIGLCETFTNSLNTFLQTLGEIKQCSLQVDDYRTFMDLQQEDESDCIPIPKTDRYTFEFKNVSYKYAGQENYAVKNFNLTLEAGKRLAVVGLNGAGKTTFIKLLLRLYDVTDGEILLNGINIKRFRRSEYFTLFAPVFQNVELYAFPMSENVSMKRPEETDKALVEKCLESAGLGDKVRELSGGVDTQLLKVIYDDGVDLSGGERQKLALARALYKNAPVMVLDEPTAALDPLAEYNMYRNFDETIGSKSAVYISHRLSSTRFCDSIAMFKNGELIQQGTHEELLEQGGAYAEMFEIQAQYYKDKEAAVNV